MLILSSSESRRKENTAVWNMRYNKGKGEESDNSMLISLFEVTEATGEYITESVIHGYCDARPVIFFSQRAQ